MVERTNSSKDRYFPEIIDEQSSNLSLSPLTAIIQELRRKNVVTAAAASGPQMSQLDSSDPWGSSESLGAGLMDDQSPVLSSHQASSHLLYNFGSGGGNVPGVSPPTGTVCGDCQSRLGPSANRKRSSWSTLRNSHRLSSFGYSSPPTRFSSNLSSSPNNVGDFHPSQNRGPVGSGPSVNETECPECGRMKGGDAVAAAESNGGLHQTNGSTTWPSFSRQGMSMTAWMDPTRTERLESPQHAASLLQATPQLRLISQASTDMQGTGHPSSSNLLNLLLPVTGGTGGSLGSDGSGSGGSRSNSSDYRASLVRDRANQQAAAELASLLWILAHEMSLEDYGSVETDVFTSVFALVHSQENEMRMAGLSALDALIDAPSADEETKAIKFANTLSNGLRSAQGDYEFLSSVSKALGHMAKRTTNVDFVESEVTRALEWLRTERSDRRLAACLSLKEFSIHAPTTFYSKTSQSSLGQGGSNEFLDYIFEAVRDPQPIVRACAADALSQCLKILMDRQHLSLTGLLCQVHFSVMEGLEAETSKKNWSAISKVEATQHGSLLVVGTMLAHTRDFMLPRYDEVCRRVMEFSGHPKALMRLEVIRLLPRLARRAPRVFARRYLEQSLDFLLESASTPAPPRARVDLRPSAFSSVGLLILAMSDTETGEVLGGDTLPTIRILDDPECPGERHVVELSKTGAIYKRLDRIFALVRQGLKFRSQSTRKNISEMHVAVFHCAADLVEALSDRALPYIPALIDDMFRAGLSNDLIRCLHAIAECVPEQQSSIEDRLLQEVSFCLAGIKSAKEACDTMMPSVIGPLARRSRAQTVNDDELETSNLSRRDQTNKDFSTDSSRVRINSSRSPEVINDLVQSLQTLGSFGDSMGRVVTSEGVVPLLQFVEKVAAQYLSHPSSEVRRAAALTCCILLVPPGMARKKKVGSYSARVIQNVLDTLIRIAVSDPSPVVRLCVVRALDSRYDSFLCQAHHLQPLFLLLQDEVLATRATGVQLLGRLATLNPAPILPYMRKFLLEVIVELKCGVDTGRGREEATRLLVVFLRSKALQRLVHPVLPALVESLPLNGGTPRLASAALEALGELAKAAGASLQPWVKELVPNILATLQDQSSFSKQRTGLRTLSLIAGSTGYVIQPYIDYPKLLSQATDILPGTKRAPWALRREVIRTLGVLGALDPDRYHTVAPKARKGGAVGGAYFVVQDEAEGSNTGNEGPDHTWEVTGRTPIGNAISIANSKPVFTSKTSSAFAASKTSSIAFSQAKRSTGSGEVNLQANVENDDNLPVHLSMYEQYAMVALPVSSLPPARRMTPSDEEFYPTVAIQALMRIFKDPSLAVHHGMVMQAIMFIFKSLGLRCVPFLSKVVPHIMLTIRTCGPSNLRESLLKQVATLSGIVREHLRPYVADVFDIVEQFWPSRHLGTIFSLVLHIAVGVPDEFRKFVPRLIRRMVTNLDEMQVADWASTVLRKDDGRGLRETERLRLILCSTRSLRGVLEGYLHVLVPALLKLSDSLVPLVVGPKEKGGEWTNDADISSLTVLALQTVSALLECEGTGAGVRPVAPYWGEKSGACIRSGSLSARVVQPLIRLLGVKCKNNRPVGMAIVETLCVCAKQLGRTTWMPLYHHVARVAIEEWQETSASYEFGPIHSGIDSYAVPGKGLKLYDEVIYELQASPLQRNYNSPHLHDVLHATRRQDSLFLLSGEPMPPMLNDSQGLSGIFDSNFDPFDSPGPQSFQHSSKQKINQAQVQRAWDVSQCASRDDWDEWMRRLAIQLLREAPSPALRAAASLAHAYQPLARELFSAAFVCCWKDLSEPYRINLIHALETAFVADVSPEILQTLLNLAEFMEHDDDGGLPIDIPILADLALKCRAYAKALHYKEREHSMGGSNSCVEALISVNRKLDLPEAALGVLKSATVRFEEEKKLSGDYKSPRDFAVDFVRHHQTNELYYSVVWSTGDKLRTGMDALDLAENKELWLAKLGSWTEALDVYEKKLIRNPHDFDAIVGCMRCLSASGEWRRVLELAEDNWPTLLGNNIYEESVAQESVGAVPSIQVINEKDRKKAFRMCADSAWRLGRWDDLEKFSSELVHGLGYSQNAPATPIGTSTTRDFVFGKVDFDGAFFSAVLHIHRNEWAMAAAAIDAARRAMDSRFTALMAESYNRAYPSMVTAQTLTEMEEIIEFKKLETGSQGSIHRHPANRINSNEAREKLLSVWRDRLAGCRDDADVHSSILAVRSLVLGPTDEVDATLTLSELSRQAQRFKLAERVLLDPLEKLDASMDGPSFGFGLAASLGLRKDLEDTISKFPASKIIDDLVVGDSKAFLPQYNQSHEQCSKQLASDAGGLDRLRIQHRLYFAYLKHLWLTDRRQEALSRLGRLCDVVDLISHCEGTDEHSLRASCWLELGEWKIEEMTAPGKPFPSELQIEVLCDFKRATMTDDCGYKAWHAWALLNFRLALQISEQEEKSSSAIAWKRGSPISTSQRNHVIAAIQAFVKAISLGTKQWSASVQQDMLNLLTCLFRYGEHSSITTIINECVETVAIDTWLGVLPQLLARIHIKSPSIRSVLHPLLVRLGEKHPQALIYPLSVLLKSPVAERKAAAEALMNSLRSHSSALVEEALMVSSELIRVAILWLETWHEGLEEASRLYFGEGNVASMLDLLIPLHEKIENGAETQRESDFIKTFGQDLAQAHQHIQEYVRLVTEGGASVPTGPSSSSNSYDPSGRQRQNEEAETAMNKAWDIYYTVFRRINKQLPALTKLELNQCSPALSRARSLELGVPGTYRVDGSYVKIEKFIPNVQVITSKQRPRKISIRGSDGKDYVFLLKGHEDLRQDERVMQLFGLVNALLERDRQTKKHDLRIQRYAISPLSHNCGLVGWVPHTDTLHSLIRDYRGSKRIPLNLEHREMLRLAPDYDMLTVMQKVEVFTDALKRTTGKGNDLGEILWLKSTNSEEWLERRTKFTRSLAVMSMVGYILGLGDRHPSNLMLDKLSGRVLHIDFGDCFEVAMMREKYPEKVPFRLTRMLCKALEVSGIEGSYRSTCERTMTVLRENRDSLVAMLEAFVYDPLISWRLVDAEVPRSQDEERVSLAVDDLHVAANSATSNPLANMNEKGIGVVSGVPIDINGGRSSLFNAPITEDPDEDGGDDDEDGGERLKNLLPESVRNVRSLRVRRLRDNPVAMSATRARSLQMYSNIQTWAANLSTDSRIASITGDERSEQMAASGSLARSRIERSMRQREQLLSLLDEDGGLANEEALNQKALKVIRRVQDKLAGTDFPDRSENGDPLDVVDQVQRLIVQATSVENLCQLFIGWCAFW